ncbi:hypothetical protein PA598K_00622 [Paenibacillus sp. 598K]|uniref:hypothetical protein n=1 Tax=Paenibacillus sp. 598K TaxID=1117987 RepID=UPI000FFADBDB|nr:hypothetical protein [Paenibacillus sp. 598K]GBF72373.1 hypothetical protein PA598K_00622 [Paenibacillus sp. 598K]
MKRSEIVENLMFFQQFIGKERVKTYLRSRGNMFPNFEEVYTTLRSSAKDSVKSNATLLTCETLATGLEKGVLTEVDIDELLFSIIEDSLFNAYLYRITAHNIALDDMKALPEVLGSWAVPKEMSVIRNVSKANKGHSFVISSYRIYESDGQLEAIRLLLLDKELIKIHVKNQEETWVAYPTLIEFDFKRGLLHIRLRDVDNIESDNAEVGTMKGRVERTLKFVTNLKPAVQIEKINNFRKSLYLIEEDVLSEKRMKAQELLATFKTPIDSFVANIEEHFNPPIDGTITPKDYISFAVLSIISTTLQKNELGDVVGIKFRNTREENSNKYAEIYISDKGYKCISSNELYWLNLLVLQEEQAVESLKLVKSLPSGFAVSRLEFSLETANVRVLQRTDHPDKEVHRQPTDEKYSDMVDYLLKFLIFN